MKEIITYRLDTTGAWGYEFYDTGRNLFGSVSAEVLRSAPVLIRGDGIDWYSGFQMDRTIIPGVSRRVKNNHNGLEVYRLIFWKQGLYQVRTADSRSIQVEMTADASYIFGQPEMPAVAMTKKIYEADWCPDTAVSVVPYSLTVFYEDVSREYMMMVLSFPALRFY